MATGDMHVNITADTSHATHVLEQAAEATAKFAWEGLVAQKPEIGSILRYHMESAKATVENSYGTPETLPDYYRSLMTELDEYEGERQEHGNDETYLAWCEENFGPFISTTDQA